MLELKVDQVLEEAEKIEKKIEKIDTAKLLKDAVNSCLDKGNIKKMSDNKEELLDLLYDKIIKNYLDFIKTNSLKTAGERVKKELEDNKKSIKSILIKSENQIKEYKNKNHIIYFYWLVQYFTWIFKYFRRKQKFTR